MAGLRFCDIYCNNDCSENDSTDDAKNHRSEESGQNLTYDEYINRCEAIFNKKKEKENTYKKIQNFQNSLLNSNGYNALLEYENAYFILGINQKAIISIRFNQNNSDVNKRLYESDLEYEIFGWYSSLFVFSYHGADTN